MLICIKNTKTGLIKSYMLAQTLYRILDVGNVQVYKEALSII